MITLIGKCGLEYKVYKTKTGTWAWANQKGEGFTNDSLEYIIEYLKEVQAIHEWGNENILTSIDSILKK